MPTIAKDAATYIGLAGYTITLVALAETTQIADATFPNPYVLRYIVSVQKTIMGILLIMVWKCYRSYFGLSTNIIRTEKSYNSIMWFYIYTIPIAILCFVSGTLYIISAEGHMTTVPTSTSITKIQCVPIFILSVLFLKQKFTLWSIMAMIVALIGVGFYVLELSSSNHIDEFGTKTHDTYYGIIMLILSTFLYSIFTILVKTLCNNCYEQDKFISGSILLITLAGLSNTILFCWWLFYPQPIDIGLFTQDACLWIMINGSICVMRDIGSCFAIALTSPFYLSVASTLSIPLAFVVDVYVHDYKFNFYAIFGALFLVVSFLMLETGKLGYDIHSFCKSCTIASCKLKNLATNQDKELLLNIVGSKSSYGTICRDM